MLMGCFREEVVAVRAAENEAKAARRGVWSDYRPPEPDESMLYRDSILFTLIVVLTCRAGLRMSGIRRSRCGGVNWRYNCCC